ncbi:MAG: DPP IV N-terminal domain-containing protein, partial [Solirubrobacterales bacterium]
MRTLRIPSLALSLLLGAAAAAAQQVADSSSRLTVERIYGGAEFRPGSFGPMRWLDGGAAYTTLEKAADGRGRDIVRYATEGGTREVLVPASRLIPAGDTAPLVIEGYSWSPDGSKLLVFTASRQVWRTNTRGDYWVLDRSSWRLRKLGGGAPPSTLMFAKFSPDGRRVGYVRQFNLYVEDLGSGRIAQLTRDGSRTVINGTFDWVYEEELGLQDGWRWSPDGRSIAFWRLDAAGVRNFDLIDDTDSLYSFVKPVQYPKAGEANSAARVGVVSAAGGPTRWMRVQGDPRNNYIARMEWAPAIGPRARPEVIIQHLNRLQDTVEVMLADAASGRVRTIFTDTDSAWTEIFPGLTFLPGGRDFLWRSERDGWSHLYVA